MHKGHCCRYFISRVLAIAHILITSTPPQVLVNQDNEASRIRKLFFLQNLQ